jgi:SAM-dependent MidA family methyltransferase
MSAPRTHKEPTGRGDPTVPAGGEPLAARLRRRIIAHGPVTFADFMRASLYDPEAGFYRSTPIGEAGDFVTSPHVSPVFATLLARQVAEFWDLLDRPDPFTLVEPGAGDGTLGGALIDAVPPTVRAALRYVPVDRSAGAREAMRAAGLAPVENIAQAGAALKGCLVANELLDNLPFHRARGAAGGPVELFVALEGGRFVLREGAPSSDRVALLAAGLAPGQEGVVPVEALDFLDRAAALFDRGYLWFADYGSSARLGHASAAGSASVHGYRRHRLEEDVLAEPGSRDITAGIDFDLLARHARARRLSVWGPVSQRDALMALGFRELDRDARNRQTSALAGGEGLGAIRAYSDRNRASILVDPSSLGGFLVMGMGIGVTEVPLSFRPR